VPATPPRRGCCINPRRARWIASKGGLPKRPSRPSRASDPSRCRPAQLLRRAFRERAAAFRAGFVQQPPPEGVAGATDPFASALRALGSSSRSRRPITRPPMRRSGRPLLRRPRGRGARRTDCGGGEDRTLGARGQTDDRERVHGWSGAASMCSKQAALRSERMALFERKFVD